MHEPDGEAVFMHPLSKPDLKEEELYKPGSVWLGEIENIGFVEYTWKNLMPAIPAEVNQTRKDLRAQGHTSSIGERVVWARYCHCKCPALGIDELVVISADQNKRMLLQSLSRPDLGKMVLRLTKMRVNEYGEEVSVSAADARKRKGRQAGAVAVSYGLIGGDESWTAMDEPILEAYLVNLPGHDTFDPQEERLQRQKEERLASAFGVNPTQSLKIDGIGFSRDGPLGPNPMRELNKDRAAAKGDANPNEGGEASLDEVDLRLSPTLEKEEAEAEKRAKAAGIRGPLSPSPADDGANEVVTETESELRNKLVYAAAAGKLADMKKIFVEHYSLLHQKRRNRQCSFRADFGYSRGMTPLTAACEKGRNDVVHYLLSADRQADVNFEAVTASGMSSEGAMQLAIPTSAGTSRTSSKSLLDGNAGGLGLGMYGGLGPTAGAATAAAAERAAAFNKNLRENPGSVVVEPTSPISKQKAANSHFAPTSTAMATQKRNDLTQEFLTMETADDTSIAGLSGLVDDDPTLTPIYYAADSRDVNIVKLLLAKGARGGDALEVACQRGDDKMASILLDSIMADGPVSGGAGAATLGADGMRALGRFGVSISMNQLGRCLRVAAKNGHGSVLLRILRMVSSNSFKERYWKETDNSLKEKESLAAGKDDPTLGALKLDQKTARQKQRQQLESFQQKFRAVLVAALHAAVRSGKRSTVNVLLAHGADPDMKYNMNAPWESAYNGHSAYEIAELYDQPIALEALQEFDPANKIKGLWGRSAVV